MKSDLLDARILIIDDQLANVEILEQLLNIHGYTDVKFEMDSRNAIKVIQEFSPNLLLLDLMMPFFSGFDILDQLNELGLINNNMSVLVLTADNSDAFDSAELRQAVFQFFFADFKR